MRTKTSTIAVAAALAMPMMANAALHEFTATLSGANEVPDPVATQASGMAQVFYNDLDTADIADDLLSVTISADGLSGMATGFHIHAAANGAETAPVRVDFGEAPFVSLATDAGGLLVSGNAVSVANELPLLTNGMIPATSSSATNQGYASMSLLDAFQSNLAYVNVHTAANPGGEIRGQLAPIPEPGTYALMVAGLGIVGWVARSRRRAGNVA